MRSLCTWVALAALSGAQLGPVVHALTAEHVTCAEHGELVEAGKHDDSASELAPPQLEETTPAIAESDDGEEHGHDHCVLASYHAPAGTAVLAVWTAQAIGFTSLDRDLASLSVPARAIFRVAPKQSPPLS